jgi:hypothetical protein
MDGEGSTAVIKRIEESCGLLCRVGLLLLKKKKKKNKVKMQ